MNNHSNIEVAKLLRNVSTSYIIKDEKKFRFQIMAYNKAADAIEVSTTELKDLYNEHKLEYIPGVGPSIAQYINELFQTDRVSHFESVLEGIPKTMFVLMEIPSIGPKKAFRLVMEFDLTNVKTVVDDLEKIAKEGKIAELEGFGEKSQADIIRAIEEFRKGMGKTTRMPLPFAGEVADQIYLYLKKSLDIVEAYPLGSLRRQASTIGDLDFGVSTNNPEAAIKHFVKYPYIQRVIEQGEVSAAILTTGGKQIDLIALKPSQLGSLLQHFTGSKYHNVQLRELALKKGLSLSERGIKKKGTEEIHEYDTEEKFYNAIGLDWIAPQLRENTGEIEASLLHKLPTLVELEDIQGDLHVHSNYPIEPSHDLGNDSMEEMIKRALELGYTYIGFSEHNPSVSKHTSAQTYDILQKRREHIEKLQDKYKKIHIISLMETDILINGDLALDDKSLELLDGTLVSIHSSFGMDREKMTERVIRGLTHPKAKILSHPTGRLLQSRPGYELDWDKIFDLCIKNNKALEINASPARLDLPDIIVKQAVQAGVRMTIDTDSHALKHMDMMKYGISVAKRGWAEKRDILNTLSAKEFIDWLES